MIAEIGNVSRQADSDASLPEMGKSAVKVVSAVSGSANADYLTENGGYKLRVAR